MLFREIIAVYCENHTEHINTLRGQNAEVLNAKVYEYKLSPVPITHAMKTYVGVEV
jgi:hypothetical protein